MEFKIKLCSEDMTNSILGGVDFYLENWGVIFGDFFTIFAYKIVNIDVESITIVTKMQTWMESQKNLEYEEFLKFWSKLGKVRQKMPFLFKVTFCDITWAKWS